MTKLISILCLIFSFPLFIIILYICKWWIGRKLPKFKIVKKTDIRTNKVVFEVQEKYDYNCYAKVEDFDNEKDALNFFQKYKENNGSYIKCEDL